MSYKNTGPSKVCKQMHSNMHIKYMFVSASFSLCCTVLFRKGFAAILAGIILYSHTQSIITEHNNVILD